MFLYVKVHEVPFNSSNKWQMSIHHMKYNDKQLLLLKVCKPITVVFIPVLSLYPIDYCCHSGLHQVLPCHSVPYYTVP